MKNVMKKSLALLLCLVMCLSLFPAPAFAEENAAAGEAVSDEASNDGMQTIVASGDCGDQGDNLTWVLYDDGELVISGTGGMTSYMVGPGTTSAPWSDQVLNRSAVKSVIIEPGVANIGSGAFLECEALTGVTIPDSVTSIDNYAFLGCVALRSITLPEGLTSIGTEAFQSCPLTNITLPNGLTELGSGAFSYCSALTSITIPENLTSIHYAAFSACSALTSVALPAELTCIERAAFANCYNLTDVYYDGSRADRSAREGDSWDTRENDALFSANWHYSIVGVYDTVESFAELKAIVDAYDGNEHYVYYNGSDTFVFEESITLPERVYFCADADGSSVRIPAGVTVTVESAARNAFYVENLSVEGKMNAYRSAVCYRTLSGEIDWFVYVVTSGECGYNGDAVSWTLYSDGNLVISGSGAMVPYAEMHGVPWEGYQESIQTVTIDSGVTDVAECAFSCQNVTSFIVSADNPNYCSIDGVLFNKAAATLLRCPEGKTGAYQIPAGVTHIVEDAFSSCRNLTEILLPDSLTSIADRAFQWCDSLAEITLPAGLTGIGYGAFWHCTSLISIEASENSRTYSSLDGVLFNKERTKLLICPAGRTGGYQAPDGVTEIGESAFASCTLTSVTLPEGLTSIDRKAFDFCALSSIYLPQSLTDIYDSAFNGCSELTDVFFAGSERQRKEREGEVWSSSNWNLYEATWHYAVLPVFLEVQSFAELKAAVAAYDGRDTYVYYNGDVFAFEESITLPKYFFFCADADGSAVRIPAGVTLTVESKETNAFYAENLIVEGTMRARHSGVYYRTLTGSIDWIVSIVASGDCGAQGNNLTWVFYDDGQLVISGSGAMVDFGHAASAWYDYRSSITSVVVNSGITSIGNFAFYCCDRLTSITLPEGLTSIGIDAFLWCSSLTDIVLPNSLTSIGWGAFQSCSSLTSVALPDSLTRIGDQAFYRCSSLRSISIPAGVNSINGYTFNACFALESISLPADLMCIKNSAFFACESLTDVYFDNSERVRNEREGYYWDSTNNSSLFGANWHYSVEQVFETVDSFAELKAIVDAYDGNEHYVYYNGSGTFVFEESITLPERLFFCADAEGSSVLIPAGVTLTAKSPACNAFYTENLILEGEMWAYRKAVYYRTLSGDINWFVAALASGDCGFGSEDNVTWVLYDDGHLVVDGTGRINAYRYGDAPWYNYRDGIRSVSIGSGIVWIGAQDFYDCYNIQSVTLSEGLTRIAYEAFIGCRSLTDITLPEGLISIEDRAFENCSTLENLVIPASVQNIWFNAFAGCSSLKSVALPSSLTTIDSKVFMNCSSLTNITIPAGVNIIYDAAFFGCGALTTVTLPADLMRIDSSAFEGCGALTDVYFDNSERVRNEREGYYWSTDYNDDLFGANWHYSIAQVFDTVESFADLKAAVAAYDGSETYLYYNGSDTFVFEESITLPERLFFCADAEGSSVLIPADVTLTVNSEARNAFYVENLVVEGEMIARRSGVYYRTLSGEIDWLISVVDSGECGVYGDNVTWVLYDDGQLVISGSGAMVDYQPWYSYSERIQSAVIESGVTNVGGSALRGCAYLTSIELPDTVMSIGYAAFAGCVRLTDVTLPVSLTRIDDRAFNACRSLTSITIPTGVGSIGAYAFYLCGGLTNLSLPADLMGIDSNAFYNCSALTDVYFDNSERVRNEREGYYWAVDGNDALFNANWHYSVDQVFNTVESFADLKAAVAAYDGSETYLYYNGSDTFVFEESITLPERLFFCADAEDSSVLIPADVTLTVNSETSNAFYVDNLVVEGEMVAHRSGVYYRTLSGEIAWFPSVIASGYCGDRGSNVTWKLNDSGQLFISGSGAMANYGNPGPGGDDVPWIAYADMIQSAIIEPGVTRIGDYAFYTCGNLVNASIPEGVTSIGVYAFYSCTRLQSVDLPESLVSIEPGAFIRCGSLTGITIPDNVTSIGDSAFWYCNNLTEVHFPASLRSIGASAFYVCSLTNVTFPEGLESIGERAFEHCTGLTQVTLPASLTQLGRDAFTNVPLTAIDVAEGSGTYSSVDGILYDKAQSTVICCPEGKQGTVTVPAGVRSLGENAFARCSGLTSIILPTGLSQISNGAFYACSGLTALQLPETVESIGGGDFLYNPNGDCGAFWSCSSLKRLYLPKSLTFIGDYSFGHGLDALTDVYYGGSEAEKDTLMGNGWSMVENDALFNATWHYAAELPDFDGVLPAGLQTIEEEAMAGCAFRAVRIPDGAAEIGACAFAGSPNLEYVYIPASVTTIAADAFDQVTGLTIIGKAGSAAESFAAAQGFTFIAG